MERTRMIVMKMRVLPQELAAVKNAMNQEKIPRVHRRYKALYLFLTGKTCKEVGETLGITPITVSNINRAYKKQGLAGMYDKVIPGRPSRLNEQQQADVRRVVLGSNPLELGMGKKDHWTASLIAAYIENRYGYSYSVRGITRMLEQMGIVYIRPHYVLAAEISSAEEENQHITG